MKWQPKGRPTEVRPFLVLPLLEGERSVSADGTMLPTTRRKSSSTSTGTWPPKLKLKIKKKKTEDKGNEIERPLTATLERPELLNINLLDKLDMSLVRKEFLCITNLCKDTVNITVVSSKSPRRGILKGSTPPAILSVTPSSNDVINKRSRKPETSEDSLESDENSGVRRSRRKISKIHKLASKPVKVIKKGNDANNNSDAILESARKPATNRSVSRSKFTSLVSPKPVEDLHITTPTLGKHQTPSPSNNLTGRLSSLQLLQKLPEPCTTCGRPDQPERFHSHPATPSVRRESPKKTPQPPANKSSVQKPVAIKYKPQNRDKSPQKSATNSTPSTTNSASAKETPKSETNKTMSLSKTVEKQEEKSKGPRTVTCYLCGREFGTKSLPLHEPKCLQKWERENSQLPRNLQRKPPTKPDKPMTPEEWNKFAWKAAQASLVPCENCGRTFLPDRLVVHQRSCKPTAQHRLPPTIARQSPNDLHLSSISSASSGMDSIPTSPPGGGPPTIECYICGRKFGSRSINIHEPQCLRKWHAQNNLLPPGERKSAPNKIHQKVHVESLQFEPEAASEVPSATASTISRPPSGPKKPMLPCYICGREYGTSSIYIHEPQCLKKWRHENDRLPPALRRKEPERPDIKFTASGNVDFIGTFHRIWQNHLNELITCKICGRKFFPDRISKHELVCNNLPLNSNFSKHKKTK